MSKKISFPKKYYMWAIMSGKTALIPHKIYRNQRDAKDAIRYYHKNFKLTWGDSFVRRILVEQKGLTHFDIYKHEFKRI